MTDDESVERVAHDTSRDRVGRTVPASVDGVNLDSATECPACGASVGLLELPAGYHHCKGCWSTWRGPLQDARIVDYQGPEMKDE